MDWFWAVSNGATDLTSTAHYTLGGGFSLGSSGQSVNVGYTDKFRELNFNLISGASSWTYQLEYPTAVDGSGNPTSWVFVTTNTNTTSGFSHSGQITFDPPSNWVTASINGSALLYYVRIRTTNSGGTVPVVQTLLGRDYVNANGGTSGTIPVFDYAADTNHDGYLNDAEYAVAQSIGDNARFACESRLFSSGYGQMRFATNPGNTGFQQWAGNYSIRYLQNYPNASGLFMDNSTGRPDATAGTTVESIVTYSQDYANLLTSINKVIAPRWTLANMSGSNQGSELPMIAENIPYYEEFMIRPLSDNFVYFLNNASTVATRAQTNPTDYGVIDSYPNGGDVTDPRTQLATLAYYYLLADPTYNFLDFYGGYEPGTTWSRHWTNAVTYNVGSPQGTWSLFASGTDPSNSQATYKVYQRLYSNALVLYKPLSFQNWSTDASTGDSTATTHQLGGMYQSLRADGTLGAVVLSITLRNGEGAILIPLSPTPTPTPSATPTRTPTPTPSATPTPTGGQLGTVVSESFDSSSALPSGWQQWSSTGTTSFSVSSAQSYSPSNGLVTDGNSGTTAQLWYNQSAGPDVRVSADIYVSPLQPVVLMARGSGLNSSAPVYYGAKIARGLQLELIRVQNGQTTSLGVISSPDYISGEWIHLTLNVCGSTIQSEVERLDTGQYLNSSGVWQSTAAWATTTTDTAITGVGYCGIARTAMYSGPVYLDDVEIDTIVSS